ncbi:MAG: formylglycine-generating enzyme family protein, partial [Synechococcaceae cyanobacterium]|nr:formylglycine-generating enzyme family protein [Synechococcaceae cyanobacterium]
RAGSTTPFHFGTTLTTDLANYNGNYTYANGPKGVARHQTTPVASFPANAWGLHDMHGNVWEWCLDHWHSDYTNAPTDGRAWLIQSELTEKKDNKSRLLRGGSWGRIPEDCRSAYRGLHYSGFRDDYIGFRVCCSPQD